MQPEHGGVQALPRWPIFPAPEPSGGASKKLGLAMTLVSSRGGELAGAPTVCLSPSGPARGTKSGAHLLPPPPGLMSSASPANQSPWPLR